MRLAPGSCSVILLGGEITTMFRETFYALVAAAALAVANAPSEALAAGPSGGLGVWGALESDIAQASFWGRPYPYGYASRGYPGCFRRVVVETPWGPRWRRVWACGPTVTSRG